MTLFAFLMLLIDHRSGLLVDAIDAPLNTHDAAIASQMHRHLQSGDVLLGDDAFSGWGHLALLLQANLHAVMPSHHRGRQKGSLRIPLSLIPKQSVVTLFAFS